ncbi:hypothetical protein KPN8_201 [Klebsiella phage KPN8]|nr:hypothetical protein KPN8_201 [Klebsiella phage KPN8]
MNSVDINTYKKFFSAVAAELFSNLEDLKIVSHRHALLNILFIDGIKISTGERRRYAFHEKHLKAVKERINLGDFSFLDEQVRDKDFQPRQYKGVEIDHAYGYVVSAVPVFTSMEQRGTGDKEFDNMTTGQLARVDQWFTDYAKKETDQLKTIADLTEAWGKFTTTVKDHDLYFGFDIEDHKISLTLDKAPPIADEIKILRQPVTLEQLAEFSEDDQKHIAGVQAAIDKMNELTSGFFGIELGNKYLTQFRERIWEQNFSMPLQYQTNIVYEFTDNTPETRALVEEQVEKVISLLKDKEAELGNRVYLDTNSLATFVVNEEGANEYYDYPVVREMWSKFVRSFGKAILNLMNQTESVYFKPYISKVTKVETEETPAVRKRGENPHLVAVDESPFVDGDAEVVVEDDSAQDETYALEGDAQAPSQNV